MQLADLERELRESAGAVLCDPRVMRRVIKHHRNVKGSVPHGRCYAIAASALRELVMPTELGAHIEELPDDVILVVRPSPRELAARTPSETATRLWRNVFHARVHLALQQKVARGELEESDLRKRINLIGQTEFDEIRAILRHDDLVMPPGDDREVYVEFAALYLELKHFAPGLLLTTFPGVTDHDRVRQALSKDIDVVPLLERGRPPSVASPSSTRHLRGTSMPSFSAPAQFNQRPAKAKEMSASAHAKLLEKARAARAAGNDVRAALLCAQATLIADKDLSRQAEAMGRDALVHLGGRLSKALANPKVKQRPRDWSLLLILGARAAEDRAVRYSVEARLLFLLQRAAIAFEQPHTAVEVATWILSLGARKIVRELPATRELRVSRLIATAVKRVRNVRIGDADRKLLGRLMGWASDRAEMNVRDALRPRIIGVFDEVGLTALSGPELLARKKVAEELIDHILSRGYLTFDALRDALSRNQLKLDDVTHPRELWIGDPLLKADAALAIALDGIYRRGDIYLRGLQKLSSIPFGTETGRALALFVVLPLGAAFVVLEGFGHLVNPVLGWIGATAITALTLTSFTITAIVVLALLHSAPFRAFAKQLLGIVSLVLATVLFRVPRAVLHSAAVRRWLGRPAVRFAIRRVLLPAGVGLGAYYLIPLPRWYLKGAIAAGIIISMSLVMGSRLGAWAEDFFVDQLAPTWEVIRRQWLPGLLRMISRFFSAMMDFMQRAFVRVDELLRFRRGQSAIIMLLKGVVGFAWAIVSYVIRLYVTLLVEPEINPLKHFPVVTVAHKLMLPFMPDLIDTLEAPLTALGPVVGATIAGVTVFLLPSVFGFLAWELKENYKLYRATRPDGLPPSPVGPHGETMRSLLVVGLHSGALPKLYERLRRAAQRQDEAAVLSIRRGGDRPRGNLGGLGNFREGLREIEQGVRRFVERELIAVLHRSPRWRSGKLSVESVDLSSNRIRVAIGCSEDAAEVAELTFEEQSGYVVAGAARPGFIAELQHNDPEQALLFENALAGLYQLAEVDIVREQIVAELGEAAHYDIADDGLVVWPEQDYSTELIYPIRDGSGRVLEPRIRGAEPRLPPPVLDTRRMSFRDQEISWLAWVAAWTAAEREDTRIPRLLRGVSILPIRESTAESAPPPPVSTKSASAGPDPEFVPLPATVAATPMVPAVAMERTLEMTHAMQSPIPQTLLTRDVATRATPSAAPLAQETREHKTVEN